jgi:hypothetical protein
MAYQRKIDTLLEDVLLCPASSRVFALRETRRARSGVSVAAAAVAFGGDGGSGDGVDDGDDDNDDIGGCDDERDEQLTQWWICRESDLAVAEEDGVRLGGGRRPRRRLARRRAQELCGPVHTYAGVHVSRYALVQV